MEKTLKQLVSAVNRAYEQTIKDTETLERGWGLRDSQIEKLEGRILQNDLKCTQYAKDIARILGIEIEDGFTSEQVEEFADQLEGLKYPWSIGDGTWC